MKRDVLELLSKMGQGKRALKLYDFVGSHPFKVDFPVGKNIRRYESSEIKGTVLLPLVRGEWGVVSYYQSILAHAFRTRGYEPMVLLCHNDLQICHQKSPGNEGRAVCDLCNFYGNKLLDEFGITPMSMSEFAIEEHSFIPGDIDETIEYGGIQISKFARASARKFLRRYTLTLNDAYHRNVYERSLKSAAKHVDIFEQTFKEKEIDAVIGSDPVYNESGIYLAAAKKFEIPTYSVASGYRDGHIMFGRQETSKLPQPQFTNREIIRNYLDQPLDEDEMETIDAYMHKRRSGTASRVPYSEMGKTIELGENDTAVGMFTNLIWDGSLEIETAPFPDVFDWIYTTIDCFIDSNETLIIRTHPVEAIRETNESVATSIRNRYGELPENIFLVDPHDDINTYNLMDDLDVAIVYNSTVGLEMAYNDLPVIVGGDTHYRKLEITHDPETPEEYVNLLDDIGSLSPKEGTLERARRYAHFLFVRKHIEFPFYSLDDSVSGQLQPVLHDDVKPGNDNFDVIVKCIIENRPVFRE